MEPLMLFLKGWKKVNLQRLPDLDQEGTSTTRLGDGVV